MASSSSLLDWRDRLLAALPAAGGPLASVQERGRQALQTLVPPHGRQEAWRFTDLARLAALPPQLSILESSSIAPRAAGGDRPEPVPSPEPGPADPVLRLVIPAGQPGVDPLDGVVLPTGLSRLSPGEVEQALGHTLGATGCEHDWPVELNHATALTVLALRVSGRARVRLELQVEAAPGLQAHRLLLILEEKADLELSQQQLAVAGALCSLVVEAHLGRGARLHHGLVAPGHPEAAFLTHLAVEQEPESVLQLVCASGGWGLSRLEPRLHQVDGTARSVLRGLQLVDDDQLSDTHSRIRFSGPEGQLDQLHKVVAAGTGRSVFNGAVQVPRAAQHTEASQMSRALLLSDRARIDTKPELEIVADDVRCAHGATVSSLQQDELFYLQSRGIAHDQAAALLKRAFCEDVLRELPAPARDWRALDVLLQEL
ncbi:MAG: SufB/SufD family protein [Cyanobacteriota bacterium]